MIFFQEVNNLPKNLEFRMKKMNEKSEIAFLDMAVHADEQRKLPFKWPQKPKETNRSQLP